MAPQQSPTLTWRHVQHAGVDAIAEELERLAIRRGQGAEREDPPGRRAVARAPHRERPHTVATDPPVHVAAGADPLRAVVHHQVDIGARAQEVTTTTWRALVGTPLAARTTRSWSRHRRSTATGGPPDAQRGAGLAPGDAVDDQPFGGLVVHDAANGLVAERAVDRTDGVAGRIQRRLQAAHLGAARSEPQRRADRASTRRGGRARASGCSASGCSASAWSCRRAEVPQMPSAVAVWCPTSPSTTRPLARWKASTARNVIPPKLPVDRTRVVPQAVERALQARHLRSPRTRVRDCWRSCRRRRSVARRAGASPATPSCWPWRAVR